MSNVKTGKTVSAIEQKKKKVIVSFDDGSTLKMGLDTFSDSPLYVGKELSDKDFKSLKKSASGDDYFSFALKYCTSDSKTTHEVWQKLEAKGASEETIRGVIHRIKEAGLLDDALYAKVYCEDVADLRLYGKKKILFELKRKGIPADVLESLPFSDKTERERAHKYAALLNKKHIEIPNSKKKSKMIAGLLQRGFEEDVALEAVADCASKNDEAKEKVALQRAYCLAKAKYEKKFKDYDLFEHIAANLMRKGFAYEDIKAVMEENRDD